MCMMGGMSNITIYVPDSLSLRLQGTDLPVSRICQNALIRELRRQQHHKGGKARPGVPPAKPKTRRQP